MGVSQTLNPNKLSIQVVAECLRLLETCREWGKGHDVMSRTQTLYLVDLGVRFREEISRWVKQTTLYQFIS